MKKWNWEFTFRIILIVFYMIVGMVVFAFAFQDFEKEYAHVLLGVATLVSGGAHALIYLLEKGYQTHKKSTYLMLSLLAVCLGIIFIFTEDLTVGQICLIWGLFDIIRSSFELKEVIPEVKENKLQIIEVFISTGDIILGVLLCIHLEHGIQLHLFYFAAAYLLSAVNVLLKIIFEKIEDKE